MIETRDICLVDCGEQEHTGIKQFAMVPASPESEGQHYLLLMSGIKTMVRINSKQYYMQPFTFLLIPFEEKELVTETQGMAAFRYMQLVMQEAVISGMRSNGLRVRETHTIAQPLVVEEIWKLLLNAFDSTTDSAKEIGVHALSLMMCLLQEASDGTVTRAAEVPHYDKLTSLRHRIYKNPEESWFIQDICDEMGISRPYFHKIYLAAFGTTCTQDVIQSRIACSKRLLETTEAPIAVVSQQSGFETDVYFMRQFKRHVGMTPTAYRRIYRQSAAGDTPEDGKKRR